MLVLITGAGGFVGRHLAEALGKDGRHAFLALGHSELDVTDSAAIEKAISDYRPDIIVHCAAISSTSYAADHPQESMRLNVMAPSCMAGICRRHKVQFITMSSDQVYGGCQAEGPLKETLMLNTSNLYGQHKLLMEEKISQANPDAIILRLSWMFQDYNQNIPHSDIISKLLTAREPIKASTKEYRGITNVDTVCQNIIRSFGILPGGVYNFGSGNLKTSYETLCEVSDAAILPKGLIIPDDSWGRNLSMDCSKLESYGISFPDTVSEITKSLLYNP